MLAINLFEELGLQDRQHCVKITDRLSYQSWLECISFGQMSAEVFMILTARELWIDSIRESSWPSFLRGKANNNLSSCAWSCSASECAWRGGAIHRERESKKGLSESSIFYTQSVLLDIYCISIYYNNNAAKQVSLEVTWSEEVDKTQVMQDWHSAMGTKSSSDHIIMMFKLLICNNNNHLTRTEIEITNVEMWINGN